MADEPQVSGDSDRLRAAGRNWGREAAAYNTQVSRLTSIQNSLPATKFQGAKGDQLRLFLSDTLKTATAMRGAYQQIGNAAPSVADAIHEAKEAQTRRARAQRELEAANKELATATADVAQAAAAVALAAARDLIGPGNATARAQEQLRAAERRRDRAQHEQDVAKRRYTRADEAFTDAQQLKQRRSEAFAHLVESQTKIIQQVSATPPPVPSVAAVPSAVHDLTVLGYGRQAIKAALDVQLLVARSTGGVAKQLTTRDLLRLNRTNGASLANLARLRELDKGGGFGPLTPKQASALSQIEKWGGRLTKANYVVSGAISLGTNYAKVANDPTLSRQQKQDLILNRFLGEFGGGVAGGLACSPSLVASAACGYGGSKAGVAILSTGAGRYVTDKASRIAVDPLLAPVYDVVDGKSVPKIAYDVVSIPRKVTGNIIKEASPVSVDFNGGLPHVGVKLPFG